MLMFSLYVVLRAPGSPVGDGSLWLWALTSGHTLHTGGSFLVMTGMREVTDWGNRIGK